jgi:toxin ParE1/3/4
MTRFVVSPRAPADLRVIWEFTERRWNEEQAEKYNMQIERIIALVAVDPRRGQRCKGRGGFFMYPAGSHLVFYKRVADGIDIVRILHASMDFKRHLP